MKHRLSLFSIIASLIVGISASSILTVSPHQSEKPDVSPSLTDQQTVPAQASTDEVFTDFNECANAMLAIDHSLRKKFNGKKLPLDYEGLMKGEEQSLLDESKVIALSDGRLLAGLGDTLYMLDARKRIKWKHTPSWILWDFAVVESTGLVYGTAGDNVMFILDAATGEQLRSHSRMGKAAYGRVVPYGSDQCLITDNFSGYRDNGPINSTNEDGWVGSIIKDGLAAWRGTELLWAIEFPPDAEVLVKGDRIYAVTKTRAAIYVREIAVPQVKDQ